MKTLRTRGAAVVAAAALAAVLLIVQGCTSAPESTMTMKEEPAETGKGGAKIWSETCANCHNLRSPGSYSDVNWDVVVQHMRVRANLTGEESRKVAAFLKAAN